MEQGTFSEYLTRQGHTEQSVKSYVYQVGVFLLANPDADSYMFKDMTEYLARQAEDYKNLNYRNAILAAIKRYYDFLIETGKRNDHPCRRIFLKGSNRNRQVIHADLFSSAELEMILEREDRYEDLRLRNKVVMSLLIYQALTPGEINGLKLVNVDLDMGRIYSKGAKTINRRRLDLHPKQYRLFDKYINEGRPKLKRKEVHTDRFVLGKLGTPMTMDNINYLVSTFKSLFPDRNLNSGTIRQSVIANMLNEKKIPLEQVQLWAGHKWLSSTYGYKETPIEEQRELVNKFHPLGK
jgi:integrase/recombinase XerD